MLGATNEPLDQIKAAPLNGRNVSLQRKPAAPAPARPGPRRVHDRRFRRRCLLANRGHGRDDDGLAVSLSRLSAAAVAVEATVRI